MTAAPHFLVVTCKLCIRHVRGTYFALTSTHNIDLASDHRQSADVLQSYTTVNEQKTTQGERGKPSFTEWGSPQEVPKFQVGSRVHLIFPNCTIWFTEAFPVPKKTILILFLHPGSSFSSCCHLQNKCISIELGGKH